LGGKEQKTPGNERNEYRYKSDPQNVAVSNLEPSLFAHQEHAQVLAAYVLGVLLVDGAF
jgi:hypothetical protein